MTDPDAGLDAELASDPLRWRRHQREAIGAIRARLRAGAREGRPRCWAVLPPGAGKTYVGLALARAALREATASKVVVLVPTTAVQGQWVASAAELGLDAATDRSLDGDLTVLTFQAVAVMREPIADREPDPDVDPEGDPVDLPEEVDGIADGEVLARLHVNGSDLVARMMEMTDLLVVLDESHHLLEAWGDLLVSMLDHLPTTGVVGLTGTPRQSLVGTQRAAVDRLFGEHGHVVDVARLVAEGDLAPSIELAWVTVPTAAERDWLGEDQVRLAELIALLVDPHLGAVGLVQWLRQRFVEPTRAVHRVSWTVLRDGSPDLADAVLRLVGAGVVELPEGAYRERDHLRPPSAEDWLLAADDWLRRRVAPSDDPRDVAALELLQRTLPAVGWVWTRRGIRRGRAMADRVLARSEAKSLACVEIAGEVLHHLGERTRLLVLADHESASSTVPMTLRGVVDRKAGSAWAVLDHLAAETATAAARPLLVSQRTVAGAPETLADLVVFVARRDPHLARSLRVVAVPADDPEAGRVPLARLVGERDAAGRLTWQATRWVREVTDYFAAGRTRVLVGTRALLGEGWDARSVTGVVDLTTATAPQPVVQVRGRALRTDPAWPAKVAVNWTVVCVEPGHPSGAADWKRLRRKMAGYPVVGPDGRVGDGVAALDPRLGLVPPPPELHAALNATALARSRDLDDVRRRWAAWRPGTGDVEDVASRLRGEGSGLLRSFITPRHVEVDALRARVRERRPPQPPGGWPAVTGFLLSRRRRAYAHALLEHARRPPALPHVAGAVADALSERGLIVLGGGMAEIELLPDGTYRARLEGADADEVAIFDTALHEAMGSVADSPWADWFVEVPLASRPEGRTEDRRVLRRAARGLVDRDQVRHHPVPRVLGSDQDGAWAYARARSRWTWGIPVPVAVGSPSGAGILAAHGVPRRPRPVGAVGTAAAPSAAEAPWT